MAQLSPTPPTRDEAPPPLAVLELLNGMWVARAVQVAAELGLADLLVEGPQTVVALAAGTGTRAGPLGRLLRALASVGIFAETEPGVYGQTPRSACLGSDHPASLRNAARMFGAQWQWRSWAAFGHAIETGQPSFDHVHGVGLLQYLDSNPAASSLFDAAMIDMSSFLNRAVLGAYDFAGLRTMADVGGGHSTLLADILRAHPAIEGTLVDRPLVADRVRRGLEAAGLEQRCRVVAGDFFIEVPGDADAYLLNRVLHDWDDERALAILHACRRGMNAGSRLLIIEQQIDADEPDKRAAFLDLQMLQLRGGCERTAEQYDQLLERAGLTIGAVVRTYSPMTIIEARVR